MAKKMAEKIGIFTLVGKAWNGPLSFWVRAMTALTAVLFVVALWLGSHFYHAINVDERVFWGVWLIVDVIVIAMLRLWLWIHIMLMMERS